MINLGAKNGPVGRNGLIISLPAIEHQNLHKSFKA